MNNYLIFPVIKMALSHTKKAVIALLMVLMASPAMAQRAYPTAEAAAVAFTEAVTQQDPVQLNDILGKDWKRLLPIQYIDPKDVRDYLSAWTQSHRIVEAVAGRATVEAGKQGWTLPIPIVKHGVGWHFDVRAGADEMRTRRIGRNELNTIQAMLAYYDAQKEYANLDRDGDGVLQYAQKFRSSKGKHDGLYWVPAADEPVSPLGSLFAELKPAEGYHGYRYRILTSQGASASGGAYSYLIKGRMVAGFALLAWPARYGETGVKSFIVSHDGRIYEKDLGPSSPTVARQIGSFNPDAGWTPVALPQPPSAATPQAAGTAPAAAK